MLSVLLALVPPTLHAQATIQVRVIAGNGHSPMHGYVSVSWAGLYTDATNMKTDRQGHIRLTIPPGASHLFLSVGSKPKEPFRIGYLPCTDSGGYPVEDILKTGLSPANQCGKGKQAKVNPGEIAFYEDTLHWWQDFQ